MQTKAVVGLCLACSIVSASAGYLLQPEPVSHTLPCGTGVLLDEAPELLGHEPGSGWAGSADTSSEP